jgi:hypothetical protein
MAHDSDCLVVIPFGKKKDAMGGTIDFDLIYQTLIVPAIRDARLNPFREDDKVGGGLFGFAGVESVLTAPVAVFDISISDAYTAYSLGLRHARVPGITILIAAAGGRRTFNLVAARMIWYELNAAGRPENSASFRQQLSEHLRARLKSESVDSPVFALQPEVHFLAPQRTRGESQVEDSRRVEALRSRVQTARRLGVEDLTEVEQEIGDVSTAPPEIVLALFDAYRANAGWNELISLVGRMNRTVASSGRVQEQLALALNRVGRWTEAEQILQGLLTTTGQSSETFGILGRVYKDQWQASLKSQDSERAATFLEKAIDAYVAGFEADWRDPYSGVNAVTLMTFRKPLDPRRDELLPIVTYAAKRKAMVNKRDYWDVATLLELSVVRHDEPTAQILVNDALATSPDPWQKEATAKNLRLIGEAFRLQPKDTAWIDDIVQRLQR